MSTADPDDAIRAALRLIPTATFVLTAAYEDRRGGMRVRWVQQVCDAPPMVVVAVEKGRPIMPLISESRQFGLCQIAEGDRLLLRKFRDRDEVDLSQDPFLGADLVAGVLPHVPLLRGCVAHLECELACHLDTEGDHDLFIGHVRGGLRRPGKPLVLVDEDPPG
jgi:flavin reductase (DIM6/NTAB) family NADH-FMN oxidoreductase RutF